MTNHDLDVLIIGAGAAGLAALRDLDRAGKRVLCLEARDRIGGRIFTAHDPRSPIPIELGAEFVHGRSPEILEIVDSAPLTLYKCTEEAVHVRNGNVVQNADAWVQVNEVMQELESAVAGGGREQSFAEFVATSKASEQVKELATLYVEGFNAARSEIISIESLVKDQKAADEIDGDDAFRIANGYEAVPRWLTQGISDLNSKLILNSHVTNVWWSEGRASVDILFGPTGSDQRLSARHVLITVPLGVLQRHAIRFHPEPERVIAAAQQLMSGQVVRVILRFNRPVWRDREEFSRAGFLLSNEQYFPAWWTPLPVQARSMTGWSSGPYADRLVGLPRDEIVRRALHDLATILSTREASLNEALEAVYFHDWHGDEFAHGAYSYVPAHAMGARDAMAAPIATTLFFAGEATETNGHSATVHGAIASGRRAARQILAT